MASLPERMVGAMKADVKTFQEIEADPNAITQAVMVIVIAGVASLDRQHFQVRASCSAFSVLIVSLIGYALLAFLS